MIDLDERLQVSPGSLWTESSHSPVAKQILSGAGTSALAQINDNGFLSFDLCDVVSRKRYELCRQRLHGLWKIRHPLGRACRTNVFPMEKPISTRWNFEYIQLYRSPVGASSLPYAVGGTGPTFNSNLMVVF